jgi:hypothetical protein
MEDDLDKLRKRLPKIVERLMFYAYFPIEVMEPILVELEKGCAAPILTSDRRIPRDVAELLGSFHVEPTTTAKVYSGQEIRQCLGDLVARGIDIDAVPGDKDVQYLFDLRDQVRPN